jgi:hypothetical protein
MSDGSRLPKSFTDLEEYANTWCLPTQAKRHHQRVTSQMHALEEFYNSMLPRMDAIAEYLNQFPLDELKDDAQDLLNLALSFIEVSLAVELFHEPDESRALKYGRYEIIESLTS